ncbi:Hypothetical predicted protein [Mytilus galloprovincialis]|uniref:Uncharacterized protein n=1 Tax=Mytilus galloprovincialis TaxID=29158 RepID=A0A8B6EDA4_MYTGA|nr:Hypothetical predicted protein [Mytilus galloprovincialis]
MRCCLPSEKVGPLGKSEHHQNYQSREKSEHHQQYRLRGKSEHHQQYQSRGKSENHQQYRPRGKSEHHQHYQSRGKSEHHQQYRPRGNTANHQHNQPEGKSEHQQHYQQEERVNIINIIDKQERVIIMNNIDQEKRLTIKDIVGFTVDVTEESSIGKETVTGVINELFTFDDTTSMSIGTSNKDWLIYTLCIAAVFIVTILSHLIRSFRKQKTSKVTQVNEAVVLEQVTESPFNSIYDEIDEDMLTDNKIYFVPQDNPSVKSDTGHGDTSYLDACFAIEDDEHQKLEDQTSNTESNSTSSSNSEVAAKNDLEYLNPYNSLRDNRKGDTHGYEVAVAVHSVRESSSESDEETTNHKYSHVYQPLKKVEGMLINDSTYATPQPTYDANVQHDSLSKYGSNAYINNNAESNKTIDASDDQTS